MGRRKSGLSLQVDFKWVERLPAKGDMFMSEKTKQKYTLSGTPQFMPFGRAFGARQTTMYTYRELSAFCLQVSLLLKAAVPLDEGLRIMAEDGTDEDEKK